MNQPRALYLLNFVSMWECFSYYGMRALLVLYMIHELKYADADAFAIYALYTALVEFGGVLGGAIADRLLGLRRSILLGGGTIAVGHICMSIPGNEFPFYLGLGLIIAGTCLFRTNASAFLGAFYQTNDPRTSAGYTLFYTGINVGGFLAAICCGYIGEMYGWHAGFGLAALGMMAGNAAMILGGGLLEGKGKAPIEKKSLNFIAIVGMCLLAPTCALLLYNYQFALPLLPGGAILIVVYALFKVKQCSLENKEKLKQLALYIVFLVLFYSCEEQLGSTLVLFIERHVDRETAFGLIPASSFVSLNPFTILITGPLLSPLLAKVPLGGMQKIALSFIFLGCAFCIMLLGCLLAPQTGVVAIGYAVFGIVFISLGEIFIGPTVFTAAAEAATPQLRGLTMGLVTLGFSLANLCSGYLSQMMFIANEFNSQLVYANGFSWIAGSACLLGISLLFIRKRELLIKIRTE